MSWSKQQFLSILDSNIAKRIFADPYISELVNRPGWTEETRAMLLHANGIKETDDFESSFKMIKLVAAFSKKDIP